MLKLTSDTTSSDESLGIVQERFNLELSACGIESDSPSEINEKLRKTDGF